MKKKIKLGAGTISLLVLSTVTFFTVFKPVNNHDIKDTPYSWVETDTSLTLNKGAIMWQYNFDTKKGKPFFHPITLNETTITELSPEDHPWHLGLWFSWKYINGINYWEYDLSEGTDPWNYIGVTRVSNKTIDRKDDFSSVVKLDVSYSENNQFDVLRESRIIEISRPSDNEFHIDYTFTFKAIADTVELNRTPLAHEENGEAYGGYSGLSLRFNNDFVNPNFLNEGEANPILHGKTLNWVYYGFHSQKGESVGTVIFDHPENLHHPTPWHITNSPKELLYFLQPAPIFHQPITMYAKETLTLKYRVKFIYGDVNKTELEKDWVNYLRTTTIEDK